MAKAIKLHLHAGVGKTGTTAIQRLLAENRPILEREGFLYLGLFFEELDPDLRATPPAPRFAAAMRAGPESVQHTVNHYFDLAVEHCRRYGVTDIVWSNEGIFNQAHTMGPVLRRLFARFDGRFVVYLRRQDDWFLSAYKQWGIKHKAYSGPIQDFEAWFKGRRKLGNYADRLLEWESFLDRDRMCVRVYERCSDVTSDFARIIGVARALLQSDTQRPYKSPSDVVLSLFKLYNSQFEGETFPNEFQRFLRRNGLASHEVVPASPELSLPNAERRAQLLDGYREQNERLDRYSTPDHPVQFPETPTSHDRASAVGYEHVVPALLLALVRMDARLQDAQLRIDALESGGGDVG